MNEELAKAYEPSQVESKCSALWERLQLFRANPSSSKPAYCIVIPPPNVTGVLHMGHALVNTLQDILIRWKRMSGYEVLWVPGTDHAGIATQTVVERQLIAKTGKRRKEFNREEFLSHVWQWKEESGGKILAQLQRMGCSCDWSHLAFTMDEPRNLAVRTMFKKMFDDGLIYRGDYLVNWDPITQTALADDEVEHEERASSLWHFRYPLEDGSSFITIATTRPETMLGDTAVVVHPQDPRYQAFIGKNVRLPLSNRLVPIVADPMVDMAFGSGAVKVTPAHDHNDYAIAMTHNLPLLNMMTPDGRVNEVGGSFAGMLMEEARIAVVEEIKKLGLLEKVEPHPLRVGLSYRSKAVIEPYLSKQWFVRVSAFKDKLREIVEKKEVELIPAHWENTYFHWINHLRDWCISRQLWWGHRIPIWYRVDNPEIMLCSASEDPPPEVTAAPDKWVQDEDVLDTWFSSALWPFSTLGWPEKTPDFQRFFPNSVLVTGYDILFFWVARMILMSHYAFGKAPFPQVFLHGLIYGKSYWRHDKTGAIQYIQGEEKLNYDLGKPVPAEVHAKWEKMSKSKGNVIDPIEIINSYGTDAMRMALAASATQARQIDLDRRRFEEFKNFANKVWNGARFVLMNLSTLTSGELAQGIQYNLLALEDRWILSLLGRTIRDVDTHLNAYAFDRAALQAYDFFWKDFCAYYLELTKPILSGKTGSDEDRKNKQKILLIVLTATIRLLHPMAPFITEELFQYLRLRFPTCTPEKGCDRYLQDVMTALSASSCAVAPFPQVLCPEDIQPEIEERFTFIDTLVHAIRNIRAEMQIHPGTPVDVFIIGTKNDPLFVLAEQSERMLKALVRIQTLLFVTEEPTVVLASTAVIGHLRVLIPLPKDMQEKEKIRLVKEREKLILQENQTRSQLANTAFIEKAPPALVDKLKLQALEIERQLIEIGKKLKDY